MTTAAVAGSRNGHTGPDDSNPPVTTAEHAFRVLSRMVRVLECDEPAVAIATVLRAALPS
jgi:hypothetical protein